MIFKSKSFLKRKIRSSKNLNLPSKKLRSSCDKIFYLINTNIDFYIRNRK